MPFKLKFESLRFSSSDREVYYFATQIHFNDVEVFWFFGFLKYLAIKYISKNRKAIIVSH